MAGLVTCHRTHSKTCFRLLGSVPTLSQNALLALNLQPLVLTHQCHASFKEGEKMMRIVGSAPVPLLRRHQCLFLQGKPYMKMWCMWKFCCALGMISAIALVSGTAVLWTGQLKMEWHLWALFTAKQQTPESLEYGVTGIWSHHSMRAEGRWESRTVLAWLLSEAVSLTQHSQILKCAKHLSALYLLQKLDALCIPLILCFICSFLAWIWTNNKAKMNFASSGQLSLLCYLTF